MIRILCRSFVFAFVFGLVLDSGSVLFAQESASAKNQQPASGDAKSNSDADLENAAKNYVERRKQAESEAARQRAIAEQAKADVEQRRQRFRQETQRTEQPKQTASMPGLTDAPKSMFAITIWAVRLSDADKNGEEGKVSVQSRTEFPTEFGSADSVRALINGLADSGRVRSSRELRVVGLEGQQAQVQVGADKPQISAVSVTNLARSNALTYRSLGTVVRVRPRIDTEKRVQLELDYNASDVEKAADVPMYESNDGKVKVTADMILSQQIQTTAKMKNGAAVMVKCDVSSASDGKTPSRQTDLLILGCETVPAQE